MKKLFLLGGLILVLLLVGCGPDVQPLRPMPKGEDQVYRQSTDYDAATPVSTKRDFSNAPAGTWIYPGKVEISNLYPGARAEEAISIHNGGAEASEFLIYYEDLSQEKDGYLFAPSEVSGWLMVGDPAPVLGPDEIRDVLVVLEVPEGVVVDVKKFGFLIVVSEAAQEGMIKVRNASKWLVTMR